jgi:DNA replication protein DnaC
LIAEIRATYDRDSDDSYMKLFRRLCSVDLLHLDDLGAERTTDWVLEQLYSIVNERWQDGRSIIVTSNLIDLEEVRGQIGARTVSRLLEICDEQLVLYGDDLRALG